MKTLKTYALLVLTVALCAVAAQAQASVMVKGNVPFNFVVGDHTLPGGQYIVKSLGQEIDAWFDSDGQQLFIDRTFAMSKEDLSSTKLVFSRYGDTYYLVELWSNGVAHEVRQPSKMQHIAKTQKPEVVAVLMTR